MVGVARDVNSRFIAQGVVATLIGTDGIAVIVNVDNPVPWARRPPWQCA
jgi:ABC-type phosphate transport system substrate-binding protein